MYYKVPQNENVGGLNDNGFFAVSIEEAATPFIVQCVKVSKLEEVSHEMLVVMLQSTV